MATTELRMKSIHYYDNINSADSKEEDESKNTSENDYDNDGGGNSREWK